MTDQKIITQYTWPPTPMGGFWEAFSDRLGADTSPVGRGATEEEAIADLLEQMGETND